MAQEFSARYGKIIGLSLLLLKDDIADFSGFGHLFVSLEDAVAINLVKESAMHLSSKPPVAVSADSCACSRLQSTVYTQLCALFSHAVWHTRRHVGKDSADVIQGID